MTRKIELPNIDNLIKRYQTGESPQKLIGEFGISQTLFYRLLKRYGIIPCQLRIKTPPDLVPRYLQGESELALAQSIGLGRTAIRKRLLEAGITPRNQSQAMFLRQSRMTPTERKALANSAHAAVRGKPRPVHILEAQAKRREALCLGQAWVERDFLRLLKGRGLQALTPQKAIGKYNIDIALEKSRVAIEINGGGWHASGRHIQRARERIPYLLDKGWHVVIIWVDGRRYPLGVGAGDYILSFVEKVRLNEPLRSEYHVIRGNGQLMTFPRYQLNDGAFIISSTSRHQAEG